MDRSTQKYPQVFPGSPLVIYTALVCPAWEILPALSVSARGSRLQKGQQKLWLEFQAGGIAATPNRNMDGRCA